MTTDWSRIDSDLEALVLGADRGGFDGFGEAAATAGMPAISVSPLQGRLLEVLARATAARRVLEIGTLAGYSTAWLARGAGPGGRVVTLEFEPRHAEVARRNLDGAGLGDRVEIRVGPAAASLAAMHAAGEAPFDLVFIDADKTSYVEYLEWTLKLTRPGSLVIADNVVRGGAVTNPGADANAAAVRAYMARVAAEPRLAGTALQTVGSKGHDGLSLAVVVEPA